MFIFQILKNINKYINSVEINYELLQTFGPESVNFVFCHNMSNHQKIDIKSVIYVVSRY